MEFYTYFIGTKTYNEKPQNTNFQKITIKIKNEKHLLLPFFLNVCKTQKGKRSFSVFCFPFYKWENKLTECPLIRETRYPTRPNTSIVIKIPGPMQAMIHITTKLSAIHLTQKATAAQRLSPTLKSVIMENKRRYKAFVVT